jgi:hypothetical protein
MKTESNLLRLPSNLGNCEQGICTKRSIQVLKSVDLNVSDFADLNEWSSLVTLEPDVSDFTDLSESPSIVLIDLNLPSVFRAHSHSRVTSLVSM